MRRKFTINSSPVSSPFGKVLINCPDIKSIISAVKECKKNCVTKVKLSQETLDIISCFKNRNL